MVSNRTEQKIDTAISLGVDRGMLTLPPQQGHASVVAVHSIF